MHTTAEPRRGKVGEVVYSDAKHEVVIASVTKSAGAPVVRFTVRARSGPGGAPEGPPPPAGKPWEFELNVCESEVVPNIRDRKARVLLTLLDVDRATGDVRVLASRAAARVPRVVKDDRESGEAPSPPPFTADEAAKAAAEIAGQPACGPARGANGAECQCPLCVGKATVSVTLTRAQRRILRVALARLARDVTEYPDQSDRVACDIGVVAQNETSPLMLRLIAGTIESTPV